MSVFISIASYCDPVLGFTLSRALETARWPGDLHFGVVDQCPATWAPPNPAALAPARLTRVRIDPVHARGPCWARAIGMSLYDGEDWFFQLDSHMDFDVHWDARLIAHASPLLAGRQGAVISAYPNAFVFEGDRPVRKTTTDKVLAHVVKPQADFEETRCAVLGVFAPVVGTIGTLQAHEALKLLSGAGPSLAGKLLMFDGRSTRFDTLQVARDPHCPVCAAHRAAAP